MSCLHNDMISEAMVVALGIARKSFWQLLDLLLLLLGIPRKWHQHLAHICLYTLILAPYRQMPLEMPIIFQD